VTLQGRDTDLVSSRIRLLPSARRASCPHAPPHCLPCWSVGSTRMLNTCQAESTLIACAAECMLGHRANSPAPPCPYPVPDRGVGGSVGASSWESACSECGIAIARRKRPRGGRDRLCQRCRYARRRDRSHVCRACGGRRPFGKSFCEPCSLGRLLEAKRRERRARNKRLRGTAREAARKLVRVAVRLGCFPEAEQCARCGSRDGVELHHLSGFAHLRDWVNVEPLCRACHQAEHARGAA
jgi:hypothetical protein